MLKGLAKSSLPPFIVSAIQRVNTRRRLKASDKALASLIRNPTLPLPDGWTEEDLRELLNSIETNAATQEDIKLFLQHFRRFVYTLSLVPEQVGLNLLELGAAPYVMTTLLRQFRDARLTLAGYGTIGDSTTHTLKVGASGEVEHILPGCFNLEKETFPYRDDSFDAVLMCEIIEHLPEDPVHPLNEIRRVLRLGGHLILTTPNTNRLENIARTLNGENTSDQYSGYGPYGRHNREWTTEEMRTVLSENGYEVETIFTADVHDDYRNYFAYWDKVGGLIKSRAGDLGQYMFVRARVIDKTAPAIRGALYRNL